MSHEHAPSGQSSERATVPLATAGERANGPDGTLDLPPAPGVAAARALDDPGYAAVAASAGLKRIVVYSHDTFGFGSVRRTLDISRHLVTVVPNLSVLIISGSPLLHASRTPSRVDYVKLPCLARTSEGAYEVKSLGVGYEELIHLRTTLTTSAILDFSPDLILVDKKPLGVSNELSQALQLLNTRGARTKVVLLLKDILDDPVTTAAIWQRHRYHEAIRSFYDRILVLGSSDIFDLVSEYRFPPLSRAKVHFCGYLCGDRGSRTRDQTRGMLGVHDERLVLVAGGSGETGYRLMANYVDGFNRLPNDTKIKSLLICGPEMSEPDRRRIRDAAVHPQLLTQEFDDDMMSCIDAADVVVSLAGYNTVCDILSLRKRAIVVPRMRSSREQLIRAERLARLGLLRALHPDRLTPTRLMHAVMEELWAHDDGPREACKVDLDGMSRVAGSLQALLHDGARLSPALTT